MNNTAKRTFIGVGIVLVVIAAVWVGSRTTQDIPAPTDDNAQELGLRISTPTSSTTVRSPLMVRGEAWGTWFFEASFPVLLEDKFGTVLAQAPAQAQGEWMTEDYVPFEAVLQFETPAADRGFVVFQKANPSGLARYDEEVRVPVLFAPTEETIVQVFFSAPAEDGVVYECDSVRSFEREVPATPAVAQAALAELLAGPAAEEIDAGYTTNIPEGVEINSIRIEEGVAYADFSEALQQGVGGSCRVSAIRAQITETLLQFPTVDEVVISIEGQTEDILQP